MNLKWNFSEDRLGIILSLSLILNVIVGVNGDIDQKKENKDSSNRGAEKNRDTDFE